MERAVILKSINRSIVRKGKGCRSQKKLTIRNGISQTSIVHGARETMRQHVRTGRQKFTDKD